MTKKFKNDKDLSQEDLKFSDETKEIEFKYLEEKKDNNLTGQEKKPDNHPQAGVDSSSAPALLPEKEIVIPEVVEGFFVEKKQLDLRPSFQVPLKYKRLVELKAHLCEEMLTILHKMKPKMTAWEAIDNLYNTGHLVPDLLAIEGKKNIRSLRRMLKSYLDSGKDIGVLVPAYHNGAKKNNIVPTETMNALLGIVLHPNEVSIGSAINAIVAKYRLSNMELACCPRTMRRALERYRDFNPDKWTLARQGMKAFRDMIGLVISRDSGLLNVGDVWIADGHKLAFDIINPATGKPKRFNLLVYFDWASRFPVGCDLNLTENSQSVKCSFRNGGLNTGYLPLYAYQDNGRAFKAKVFTAHPEKHNLEEELAGVFYRAGTCPVWAMPYNARAKSEERFFLTMQNNFERLMTTWRGANVTDKPAGLMRNEKWINNLYERKPLTIEEFKQAFNWWVYEVYGKTPHKGLSGRTPLEVFEEGNKKIDPARKINPQDLNFLMLSRDKKKISNKGINLFGLHFWDEKLVKHVGQQAFIQYDTLNLESILVYTESMTDYICQAQQITKMHPLYRLADDPVKTKAELDTRMKQQRRIEKNTKEALEYEMEQIGAGSERFNLNYTVKDKLFNNTVLLKSPEKQAQKSIAELTAEHLNSEDETFDFSKKQKTEEEEILPKIENFGFNI